MALSYEYSIGSVRSKEKSLFNSADIEQLLACSDIPKLCAFLTDRGYGEGQTVDDIIDSHTDGVWAYLKSVAPDFEIFRIFFIQNDVHNFKVVLKGTLSGRSWEELILKPCTVEPDTLREAVENRKPALLPEWLGEAADKAYETLAHTGDARLSDAIVDKAVMKQTLALASGLRSEFIKKYFNNLIFYNDIKIAIRASRTRSGKDYLVKALCAVDGLDRRPLIDHTLKGYDKLIEELAKMRLSLSLREICRRQADRDGEGKLQARERGHGAAARLLSGSRGGEKGYPYHRERHQNRQRQGNNQRKAA